MEFDYSCPTHQAHIMEPTRKQMLPGSRKLLGLTQPLENMNTEIYALWVLAVTSGCDLMPGVVALVGGGDSIDEYWPKEWAATLPVFDLEVVAKTGLKSVGAVIVCDDVNEEELLELGYKGVVLTPETWVQDLVSRSAPTIDSLIAMLVLMGAIVDGDGYTIERGYDKLVVNLVEGSIEFNQKLLKNGFMIGNDLVGVDGTLPLKALYWALWFAINDEGGNALSGKLAYLTDLYQDPGYGEVREGVGELKYSYQLGLLKAGVDRDRGELDIRIRNGGGAEVLAAAIALDKAGIPYLPGHQADKITYGPGANALGLDFVGDRVVGNIPHHRKAEKILNSFALDKATTNYSLVIEQ